MPEISTKPYLLRAIYEWCTDNGYTPYIAVMASPLVQVPKEFVKDGEIVLNISFSATSGLKMGNNLIDFKARFNGISRDISIPIENVAAIYARENGQGMTFEVLPITLEAEQNIPENNRTNSTTSTPVLTAVPIRQNGNVQSSSDMQNIETDPSPDNPPPKKGGKLTLTRVK